MVQVKRLGTYWRTRPLLTPATVWADATAIRNKTRQSWRRKRYAGRMEASEELEWERRFGFVKKGEEMPAGEDGVKSSDGPSKLFDWEVGFKESSE